MDLVSVIIPSANRYERLCVALKTVKQQTYKNLEIIVIDDASTDPRYQAHDWTGVKYIRNEKSAIELFSWKCAAYVRNEGIKVATGKWIAFLDDDDAWLPNKIELQIQALHETGCLMSSTDGYWGHGFYNPLKTYRLYNREAHRGSINEILKRTDPLPRIWDSDLVNAHNCFITSSVVVHRDVLEPFPLISYAEDYACWKKCIIKTTSVYVDEPLFFYDDSHGLEN